MAAWSEGGGGQVKITHHALDTWIVQACQWLDDVEATIERRAICIV
jgi:hypothetical protein